MTDSPITDISARTVASSPRKDRPPHVHAHADLPQSHELVPAGNLRAGDQFIYNGQLFTAKQNPIRDSRSWLVVAETQAGDPVRMEFVDDDAVGRRI
jgi:hypothetical protein